MKEHTETISESIFNHFPSSNYRGNQLNLLFNSLKKQVLSCKNQLLSGMATLGIGTVFLVAVYLFFTQLAEYGWQ
jgi:hypothetical protein